MKQQIVILPAAERDLDAGQQFYEEQAEELGAYFIEMLSSDIESLLLYGGVHRMAHGLYRCLSKRFPYAIYYRVEAETVLIHRVLDCRRDPDDMHDLLRGY